MVCGFWFDNTLTILSPGSVDLVILGAELSPGQSCQVNCLAPFEGPGFEARLGTRFSKENYEMVHEYFHFQNFINRGFWELLIKLRLAGVLLERNQRQIVSWQSTPSWKILRWILDRAPPKLKQKRSQTLILNSVLCFFFGFPPNSRMPNWCQIYQQFWTPPDRCWCQVRCPADHTVPEGSLVANEETICFFATEVSCRVHSNEIRTVGRWSHHFFGLEILSSLWFMIFVRRRGLKFLVFCSRSLIFPKQISAGAPLRVSEPNCTLPCPMPEPIPYGYTNASGEWRCDQGAGGQNLPKVSL